MDPFLQNNIFFFLHEIQEARNEEECQGVGIDFARAKRKYLDNDLFDRLRTGLV